MKINSDFKDITIVNKAGNIEYYHCEKCGKNYLDEAATQEAENVVIAKLSHLLSHVDAVYADAFNVFTTGVIPCALAANAFPLALAVCATASNVALSTEALDDTSLFLISTILFTGCLVILVEISFLDISMSF